MANVKKRLDVLLVERGLAESRQRAQAVIMSGQVYVREQKVDKAGTQVEENAPIEVRGQALAYVSRGGLKLEKALKTFSGIRLKGVHAIDAGGVHRRLYRLYAPKWGGKGVCSGCGLWTVGLEPAQ